MSDVGSTLRACSRPGNRIPFARTVAEFIIKSSLLVLSFNRDSSAHYCCSIMNPKLIIIPSAPPCCKPMAAVVKNIMIKN
jgi:hypothetical protein